MADPIIKKIDQHPNLVGVAAIDDKVLGIDTSQLDPAQKTVLISMNQISIHTASQLAADVVESVQIKDAAVTATKIGADAVSGTKIADDSIDSEHYVDGSIDTAHIGNLQVTTDKLAANAVTEAKLGTIKRTVVIRVMSPDDTLTVGSTLNFFPFPVSLNNFIVIDARMNLSVASSSGNVTVELKNQGGTMATLSLAAGATGLSSSGTINTSYKTAITNNFLGVNVTAAGTGAKGLTITLVLQGVPA